jgi:hypothetical protein
VVFHAVLQHTLRPQDHGRPGIRCCVYKRHRQNSNGCLSRSFADIKELLRLLFHCATFATSVCGSVRRTRHIGDQVRFITNLSSRGLEGAHFVVNVLLAERAPHVVFLQQDISRIICGDRSRISSEPVGSAATKRDISGASYVPGDWVQPTVPARLSVEGLP